jgi:hypothetical protein
MTKKGRRLRFPLIHSQLSAERAWMLNKSNIIHEPRGTKAFEVWKRLRKAEYDKAQMGALTKDLEPWQAERMGELLDIRERQYVFYKQAFEGMDREMKNALKDKKLMMQPLLTFITMTEKCNRGCPHCAAAADMKGMAMPFADFERYVGLAHPQLETIFTGGGEPFLYSDGKKDLGDAVKLVLDRFRYTRVKIVTSGISMENGTPWASAAEKIAGLGDVEKERVSIHISARTFTDRTDNVKETLKFFIDSGITAYVSIEGLGRRKCDDGKYRTDLRQRNVMIKDLMEAFGASGLDRIASSSQCRTSFAFIGRMVSNFGNVVNGMKEYFGKNDIGKIRVINWEIRPERNRHRCRMFALGLVPDGTLVNGCCSFPSQFMRFCSLKGATHENILGIARQMAEDKHQFLAAQRKWKNKESCVPCIRWFAKMGKKTNGRVGIRNIEKFRSVLPTQMDVRRINYPRARMRRCATNSVLGM